MPSITYTASIWQQGNHCAVPVPEEALQALGAGRRPLVKVTLNGYTYRSAVATMDGQTLVSLSAANRQAAGVNGGDTLRITLELDDQPRDVDIPSDLLAALQGAGKLAAFEKSAPSARKEAVRQVLDAKAAETRARRIAKIVDTLAG